MIAPKPSPAAPQSSANGIRPICCPVTRPMIAPKTPQRPQATICQGVQGPWPKSRFEASAATAPTTKPGAPPSANPAMKMMSVVGLTLGIGAKAIRPIAARPASVATRASIREPGCVRSYQRKPLINAAARIASAANSQFMALPRLSSAHAAVPRPLRACRLGLGRRARALFR